MRPSRPRLALDGAAAGVASRGPHLDHAANLITRTREDPVFVKLVPNEQVVEVDEFEVDEFETADPALRGEMTSTITLADVDSGTELVAVHENLPPGLSPSDNETGWRMALYSSRSLPPWSSASSRMPRNMAAGR